MTNRVPIEKKNYGSNVNVLTKACICLYFKNYFVIFLGKNFAIFNMKTFFCNDEATKYISSSYLASPINSKFQEIQ